MVKGYTVKFLQKNYATWYSIAVEVVMEFSQRLRQLRERRGLSQNALAKTSGVAQAVIHRLEAGTREMEHLSVGVAMRLARALGVSVDHLVGITTTSKPTDGVKRPRPRTAMEGTP